ncbi:hypothetical protein ACFLUD_04255 [Chloroflexota bacterium]
MERIISLGLAVVMILGCTSLVACGGGEEIGTTPSGSVLTWDDMPVYPGAKQIEKGSWPIPEARGEWSKIEWRYYETIREERFVLYFFKTEMLNKGWREDAWVTHRGTTTGSYSKNNKQDGAMTWTYSFEGGTIIALMRATK